LIKLAFAKAVEDLAAKFGFLFEQFAPIQQHFDYQQ